MKFWRVLLFGMSVAGPLVKVRLIGATTDIDTQLLYVGYYFSIQFFIPLVDFGSSWSSIRIYLEKKSNFILFVAPLGIMIGTLVGAFLLEFGLVILISVAMALLNYHLQVFRLLGKSIEFYFYKIIRLVLDISLFLIMIATFNYNDKSIISNILTVELISIIIILSFIAVKRPGSITYVFKWFYFAEQKDYFFLILKVIRANFTRLIYPLMFANPQFLKVFYLLLLYELVVQFANSEYLKRIVNNGINFNYAFILLILSFPVQLVVLIAFSEFMSWHFSFFEYVCVSLMGSITVYSIFSFRLISLGCYQEYRRLVFCDVICKIIIFIGLYLIHASYSQTLIGLLLNYFIWFGWFSVIHNRAENAEREKS